MEKTKVSTLGTIGILSISLMMMAFTAVTPAMAVIGAHFTGKDVSFVASLATLGVVVGSLVGGGIAGKVITAKNLAIIGNIVCLILGCLPMVIDNYVGLLVSRLAFGFALGLVTPLAQYLIAKNYEGPAMNKMMGFSSMAMSLGGIIFQLASGMLADKGWQYAFASHLFFIVAIVLCLFIPKDELMAAEQIEAMKAAEKAEKMYATPVIAGSVLLFLFQVVNMGVMLTTANMYVERGFGSAAQAGIALTFYTIGGVVAGLIFGGLFNKLKKAYMPATMIVAAAGMATILFSSSSVMACAGFFLLGVGFTSLFSAFTTWIAMSNPMSKIGFGTGIMISVMQLGGFFTSFWMMAVKGDFKVMCTAVIIVCIGIAVITAFVGPFNKKKEEA